MAITYSLLEDGSLRVLNGLPDLLVGGVWAHNAILALSGGLRVPSEVRLEVLVAVDGCLQPAVHLADLRSVAGVARLRLRLDVLDAADEAAVASHDLRAEVVDLARGHIGARKDLLEGALKVVQLAVELVEGAVDFAALVEDGIGVGAAALLLSVGLHLDCAGCLLSDCALGTRENEGTYGRHIGPERSC